MRAVILAAGYGTRLQRDLEADTSGQHRHLLGVPKPLLPIGGVPLVERWVRALEAIQRDGPTQVQELVVVVNASNQAQFQRWRDGLQTQLTVTLVCDGATSNETRPGAVACMQLGVGGDRSQDVLFIGGDTLFPRSFSLAAFLSAAAAEMARDPTSCHVTAVPCPEALVSRHGILELDSERRVVRFWEKPQPTETASRVQCPCFYLLPSAGLPLLDQYLATHRTLQERDATGLLVASLAQNTRVVAHPADSRYDVGNLQTYLQCCSELSQVESA